MSNIIVTSSKYNKLVFSNREGKSVHLEVNDIVEEDKIEYLSEIIQTAIEEL